MSKAATDTRTGILTVALQLFLKKGYKDVSYQDLIKKTGLSKGAIYYHFKSKEDILVSTFEFLLEATQQPLDRELKDLIRDQSSFKKLFINAKREQFNGFKKLMKTKSLKFNRMLFFLEAINENEKLKKIVIKLMEHETEFLEQCFQGLKRHNQLPKGKSPALLAEGLFWMLQGSEMLMFFLQNKEEEEDFIKMYEKTIEDFFKII